LRAKSTTSLPEASWFATYTLLGPGNTDAIESSFQFGIPAEPDCKEENPVN
jgi:hypothetical protein